MYLDNAKNLSLLNNISCSSITATGALSCGSTISYTSLTSTKINQSGFLSFKGYTYYDYSADFNMYRYYYIKYDGNVSVSSTSTINVDANCYLVKITFTYSTTSFYTTDINGSKEYIFVKRISNNLFESMYSSYIVGRDSYQPTFDVITANRIIISWSYNGLDDNLSEYLYWNCAVFVN